jgi:hypothetical protein
MAASLVAPPADAKKKKKPAPQTCEDKGVYGTVVKVKGGRIHINVGSKKGIEKGTHVAVVPRDSTTTHPDLGYLYFCGDSPEVTAVVEIDEVSEKSASGPIGRTAAAHKGDMVFVTDSPVIDKRGFPAFPRMYKNVFDISLRFRILAGFDGGGAAFPMDLFLSYQTPAPVKVGVFMLPAVLSSASGGEGIATLGGFVTFSSRYFEFGFGVGGHMNSPDDFQRLGFLQIIRIGAEHGMRLRLYSSYVWDFGPGGDERGLRWDSLFAEIVVPVHTRVALFWEGGGGGANTNLSQGRFTTGAHVYLKGAGGPGTIVLPVGLGFGVVDYWGECLDDMCGINDFWHIGMTFTLGLDARF